MKNTRVAQQNMTQHAKESTPSNAEMLLSTVVLATNQSSILCSYGYIYSLLFSSYHIHLHASLALYVTTVGLVTLISVASVVRLLLLAIPIANSIV